MTRRSVLEVAGVALTAGLSFVFYDMLSGRAIFIAAAVIGWAIYLIRQVRRDPGGLAEYGLSRDGLGESSLAAAAVFAVGALICAAVALSRGGFRFSPHMLPLALLYPVWGIVQQCLVQALVVRNLARVMHPALVVAIAGVLFGVIHFPYVPLAVATAGLGAVFTVIFLRYRNVWPLGVCHGWLGVVFYFWVLQRDPWLEIVATV